MDKELIKTLEEMFDKKLEPINDRLSSIEKNIHAIKDQQDKDSKRLKSVFEQTAALSEFRTEINNKIDDIKDEVEFLTKKEIENEKDIFKLKKRVQ
ncbi:MAG: hypothetical protein ACOCRO_10255 [Halanaerobiales bacterium]